MKRRDLVFVAGILVLAAALFLLGKSGKKVPFIPPDKAHVSATTKEACLGCHAEGRANPLKKEHPPKDQCFECHKYEK